MTAARHVVFGTGAIGLATMDALRRRGETVRMVDRRGSAPVPDDVEVVGGDAADPRVTVDVTRVAAIVHRTLNPPYARWVDEFPASGRASSPARRRTGPGWSAWRTSTCTGDRRDARSPRPG
jgi:nucleoside-diphosphate-sugar epimerase